MSKHQLWIVVENELKPYKSLNEAVKSFKSLADFITEEGKVICLTYDSSGQPEGGSNPMWEISEVPLKEIAAVMKEAT